MAKFNQSTQSRVESPEETQFELRVEIFCCQINLLTIYVCGLSVY
jgi:hypothetical protein